MDEAIQALDKLADHILRQRDSLTVEELVRYVDERGKWIAQIMATPLTEVEKKNYGPRINQLLQKDDQIKGRMELLREEAARHLNKLTTAKAQRHSYETELYGEGAFFDKRR